MTALKVNNNYLTVKLFALHFVSKLRTVCEHCKSRPALQMWKYARAFLSQVPNPQRLVPRRWYECERPILGEDQVPHNTFMAMEIKHGITYKKKKKGTTSILKREAMQQMELNTASSPAEFSPVNTFQILITPFSKPVARRRLLVPLDAVLNAADFGGLGPKARPHTGWPQLKLLSPRSISPFWASLQWSMEMP